MYEKQNVPEVRLKCMLRDMPSICHIKTLITLVYLNNQWIYSTNTKGTLLCWCYKNTNAEGSRMLETLRYDVEKLLLKRRHPVFESNDGLPAPTNVTVRPYANPKAVPLTECCDLTLLVVGFELHDAVEVFCTTGEALETKLLG